ncbi:hypothetical protein MMC29_003549, partial [Sticta canariensis]|nr:hypothetical protein [Sticta canariensis]
MPFDFKRLLRPRDSRSQSPRPASSSLIPEPSLVAPQDLPVQLSQTNISPEQTTSNTQASPAPIGKGDNYGAIELFHGGTKATVDIVFVHGLTGNSYNTWFHEVAKVHWPSQLLSQDIPDARILSFGYDADIVNFWRPASNNFLSNHAEKMVSKLASERRRTSTESRKIIFVAHSLGGLVTQRALSHSRDAGKHLRQIERCTVGIVFLGVPHCGADLESWATIGTQMVGILRRTNKDIVKVLNPGSEMLREVQKDFHKVLAHRKESKDEGCAISITCFYEELPVPGVGEIVPKHSAEMKGYDFYGIHANHMDMTKFPSREDDGYDSILEELQRWKKEADDTHASNSQVAQLQANLNDAVFNSNATASPDSINHHWLVPRSASTLYTGRRELGERLAQLLSFDPLKPQIQQRIFVIIGIGGTGKSEACLKFAEDHQNKYWGVFWLDASSIATAEKGYIDIGRQCNVPEPNVSNVKLWLAGNRQPWLLIIDNADNPEIDYSNYMPYGTRGDILLTTRNPECGVYNTVGVEKMGDLEPEQARELLLRTTDIEKSRWEERKNAAMAVVNTLGSHTLAIIQAGAFIKKKLCTLEGYPELFKKQKGQLLRRHSNQKMSPYRNVYTTFEVSAEYLQNSKLPECLYALDLLHIFAFMHNSEISETIFHRASEYAFGLKDVGTSNDDALSLSVHHIARLPKNIQPGSSNSQDLLPWREACTVLASLSIITQHGDDDSFTISAHSLVHAWAKERQDDQSRCRAWQSAATIIALSCQGRYRYCPFYILIQSHVRACVDHEIEVYTKNISDVEAAQLLFQFAYVLDVMRDDSSLDFLVQRVRLRLQDRFEANHEITLEIKFFSGRVSQRQGDFVETVHIFEEIVENRSQALAEDHPDRLASQHALAGAYQANGQVGDAVELLEHVVKIEEKLAEDHPSRLASQHGLAGAYQANGQVGDAVKLLEHVVKIQEKLAESHPSRITSLRALARAYETNGQLDEANVLFEQ